MKIIVTIARSLLGVMFIVFGLNGFLHFIPQQAPLTGLAGQFVGALIGPGLVVTVFWLIVAFQFRSVFKGILMQRPTELGNEA